MYNMLTRAGIPLRPRKEQNTMEIEKALELLTVEELQQILNLIDFLALFQSGQKQSSDC